MTPTAPVVHLITRRALGQAPARGADEGGTFLGADANATQSLGLAGRYAIRRELGRGMMGVVYQAEDTLLGRTVALKTIELAFGVGEESFRHYEERFFTEARVAAKLSHPGIVVCHDVGKDPATGKLFIVFEYLKGRTLAERVLVDAIGWREALAIMVKVGRAIQHAHANGVIHRDLKPANVMLLDARPGHEGDEAAVKIMDFGVARLDTVSARLTRTGQWFGSPLYMSPEQVLGQAASARSDIFSLGSVLCTLLLGRGWFEARSIPEVLARVVHAEAPPLSQLKNGLPEALDSVVSRAMAKRAEDRYPTAAALADDLEDVLADRVPRHASGFSAPPEPALPGVDPEALLTSLTATRAGVAPTDAADPLAALLDEAPAPVAPAIPVLPAEAADQTLPVESLLPGALLGRAAAEATLPSWEMGKEPEPGARPLPSAPSGMPASAATDTPPAASAETAASPRRLRRVWIAAAVAVAAMAAGAFLLRGRAPVPPPKAARSEAAPDAARFEPSPASAPSEAAPSTLAPEPASAARTAPIPPAPAPKASLAVPPRAVTPEAAPPSGGRVRLAVTHPLENGRLVVWIDGALAYETKLAAPVSKTIVAIKLREGHLQKTLDVPPGRHEVRVEMSWGDEHRSGSVIVDVPAGSAGLLQVRLARITKDLSLEWSRPAHR